MKKYRKLLIIICLILLFVFVTLCILYAFYLSPVNKSSDQIEVKIASGMSSQEIGELLEEKALIKSDKFFVLYLKINGINDLKAGTYNLSSNMPLKEIVQNIREGNSYNDSTITITFKEGINFREIARVIENNTNNSYDDVLNQLKDEDYLKSLIEDYWFLTDDILNSDIYYPLEGYLFPDTYEFRSEDVTVPEIFKKLLDQMDLILSSYEEAITASSFSVHELLTLASIAEKEVNNSADRSKVVSVFLNRLDRNMALGSDVTTRYGLKLDDMRPLTKSEYASSNPYNTRNSNMTTLPASPIATVSKSSIEASIYPADTNYLYFISNIQTDETFFFENSRDFEAKKQELAEVNSGY